MTPTAPLATRASELLGARGTLRAGTPRLTVTTGGPGRAGQWPVRPRGSLSLSGSPALKLAAPRKLPSPPPASLGRCREPRLPEGITQRRPWWPHLSLPAARLCVAPSPMSLGRSAFPPPPDPGDVDRERLSARGLSLQAPSVSEQVWLPVLIKTKNSAPFPPPGSHVCSHLSEPGLKLEVFTLFCVPTPCIFRYFFYFHYFISHALITINLTSISISVNLMENT